MSDLMTHIGTVTHVTEDHTATVEVLREHACVGCLEKSACSMQSANNVRITFRHAYDLNEGDSVEIIIRRRDFFRSMALVYIIPLILMLITALAVDAAQKNQLITAVSTLGVLAVYFVLLRFLHKGKDRQEYRKI